MVAVPGSGENSFMVTFTGGPLWAVTAVIAILVLALFFAPDRVAKVFNRTFVDTPQAKMAAAVAAAGAFLIGILTVFQIVEDLGSIKQNQKIQREEAIARAVERLFRPASGRIFRGDALSFVVGQRQMIVGLDLSCKQIGAWDEAAGTCVRRQVFENVRIDGRAVDPDRAHPDAAGFKQAIISHVSFADAHFIDAFVANTGFYDADLSRALFMNFVISGAFVSGDLTGAQFNSGRIIDTEFFPAEPEEAPSFSDVNVSGSSIPWLASLSSDALAELTFWADWPPRTGEWDTAPIPREVLAAMTICLPPVDGRGRIVPREHRADLRQGANDCRDIVSLDEAVRDYGASYE